MVTTQRQIIEKMLDRRLTKYEWKKLSKVTHIKALKWAKDTALKEGRKPGYTWVYRQK